MTIKTCYSLLKLIRAISREDHTHSYEVEIHDIYGSVNIVILTIAKLDMLFGDGAKPRLSDGSGFGVKHNGFGNTMVVSEDAYCQLLNDYRNEINAA